MGRRLTTAYCGHTLLPCMEWPEPRIMELPRRRFAMAGLVCGGVGGPGQVLCRQMFKFPGFIPVRESSKTQRVPMPHLPVPRRPLGHISANGPSKPSGQAAPAGKLLRGHGTPPPPLSSDLAPFRFGKAPALFPPAPIRWAPPRPSVGLALWQLLVPAAERGVSSGPCAERPWSGGSASTKPGSFHVKRSQQRPRPVAGGALKPAHVLRYNAPPPSPKKTTRISA